MDNDCYIPDLAEACSWVENCGLDLVLKLAKLYFVSFTLIFEKHT